MKAAEEIKTVHVAGPLISLPQQILIESSLQAIRNRHGSMSEPERTVIGESFEGSVL